MATEALDALVIKDEPDLLNSVEAPLVMHQCQAPHQNCTQPVTQKRDGTLHELCALHRRQVQRTDQQRKRLLLILVDALKPENHDPAVTAESARTIRRRPRLVLLGNQQTMILGVVISERGGVPRVARSML